MAFGFRCGLYKCMLPREPGRLRARERAMGGWAIAVHGGAGVDPNLPPERQEEAKNLLTRCLNIGISALRSSLPAIDVVELVVRSLSFSSLFFHFIVVPP